MKLTPSKSLLRTFTILLGALSLSIFFLACSGTESAELKPLDLLSHGMPITILAPDSAKVTVDDLIVMKDITVKDDEDYYVQILSSNATSLNLPELIADQKKSVEELPSFSRIVEEKESGFIYEIKYDSLVMSYDFRHMKLKGDREYIFQTGLIGRFSLDQAKGMYEAVDYTP